MLCITSFADFWRGEKTVKVAECSKTPEWDIHIMKGYKRCRAAWLSSG